jgi:acyl carrier protein
VLSEKEFIDYLRNVLDLEGPVDMGSHLINDLAFDSLTTYELLVAVEEELGGEVDEAVWVHAVTVGDCYSAYRNALHTKTASD